jgi:N-acetylglucosaminyl-diphospho-decaprenol L-rhamnosyltransferase
VPDLAVVIVSANSAHWLRPCLSTLSAHAGDIDLDVVVVAAGCSDDTVGVASEFDFVRTLTVPNRGFAYGNNRGFEITDAPYVLFLNPDTEILDGSFDDLLADLDRRPEVGLVGVRSETREGVEWPTIRRFPTVIRMLGDSLGLERLPFRPRFLGERELDPRAYEQDTPCDWVSGSYMLARREALLGAGLMDERFFIYCEEPDLCLRIVAGGWQIRHLPSMRIFHNAGSSGFKPRFIAQEAYARRQYMEKHFTPMRRRAGLAAYALGFLLRATVGGRSREHAAEQRAASRAALRVLLGRAGAPFAEPPGQAVAPAPREPSVARSAA